MISIELYGFGSYFNSNREIANDIDLLILSEDVCTDSINFSIQCKSYLIQMLQSAHVVMLSKSEEKDLDFKNKSKAIFLKRIFPEQMDFQLSNFVRQLD
ncbi:hypothetical protein [Pedobacter sp. WC2423]|uniref:hypothetical protein n=1 Tax=Pedobacter sp. WC2423 TaxID=3234142 RepID=UPI0034657162